MNDREKTFSNVSNMVYILKQIKEYDIKVLLFMLLESFFGVLVAFCSIIFPAFIIRMIEKKYSMEEYLINIGGLLVFYAIFYYANDYVKNRNAWQYVEFRAGFLMKKLMNTAINLPYDEYCDSKNQERFTTAQDCINSNTQGIEKIIINFVAISTAIGSMLIYLVSFGIINPAFVLLILFASILQFLIYGKANYLAYEYIFPKSQQEINMNYLNRQAVDTGAAKDVRLFQMQDWLISLYEKSNYIFSQIVKKERKNFLFADILGLIVEIFISMGCYGYLLYLLKQGMKIATFVMIAGIIQVMFGYAKSIPEFIAEMNRYLSEFSECRRFLEKNVKKDKKNIFLENEKNFYIEFCHVTFCYVGSKQKILDDVSFKINPKSKIALVGENGAGKSTIIYLICGFYKPTSGDIYINGINTKEMDREDFKKIICTVFQDSNLLNFSIAENIACETSEKIEYEKLLDSMKKTSFYDRIEKLEQKENTYIGTTINENGINLSGGELQKLFITRALYANRGILLLDEPTAALDAITENEIYQDYNRLCKDKTTIFISHRLASTRFCDEIWLLKGGKIIEKGTHDELIRNNGEYAKLYLTQSKYYMNEIA